MTYRPSFRAQTYAKGRLELGFKMHYDESYTVSMMVEVALEEDFYFGIRGSPDTAAEDAVKAWATDLYRGRFNPHKC